MFDNDRYMTKGIVNELPMELQLLLWGYIDELKNSSLDLDYLQIFYLSEENINGKRMLKVVHEQEIPPYKAEHILFVDNPVNIKVYVIDDETHCTMLLASEY